MFAQQSASEAATAPPQACATDEHAGLDFWVGEWDVYPRANPERQVANSRIERLHSGCAIREQWLPLRGTGGSSLSHYDPSTGQWRQLWIGSAPGSVEFSGGVVDGEMVLTGWWPGSGPNGENGLIRMTYTAISADEVRQHGEFSADHGQTWSDNFDFIYRRRSEPLQD
ncbi:MAG TPA: hypothetical protein VLA37_11635 [Sphingomonadaceae bacterium]|nr:hypothetical protein [Sphingomonadaceae bacterium]